MAPDDPIGKLVDKRYRIERRLGSGGMGVVYAAEHVGLDRRVAIKLLRTEHVEPTLLARFRREAKLASRIRHPNIVEVFDVGSDGGLDFIAMELIDGQDLGGVLAGGALAIDRALALARQMLEALQAVHDADIIHRDIKPSNVLVAPGDVVKLMDFGIARGLQDATLTRTGLVVGTTEFMAPEQLRGGEVDHRADLYAVGITLFAMLTGDVPFRGATMAVAGAQVFSPPPSLAKLRPELPVHVVAAVERALAKAPGDRFADARAFAAALAAPAEASATLPARPSKRARAPVTAAPAPGPVPRVRSWALVLVAGLAGIALALIIRRVTRPPAVVAAIADSRAADAAVRPAIVAPDAPAITVAATPTDAGPAPDGPSPRGVTPLEPVVERGAAHRCHCIPGDAPDVQPLCHTAGPPRCRCNDANRHSLCEHPLTLRCWPEYERRGREWVIVDGGNPCVVEYGVCDYDVNAYRREGVTDAPCTGYVSPWEGEPGTATTRAGHTDCDVCAGTDLGSFVGHAGEACTGFYWRTGEVRHGKLDFCH